MIEAQRKLPTDPPLASNAPSISLLQKFPLCYDPLIWEKSIRAIESFDLGGTVYV